MTDNKTKKTSSWVFFLFCILLIVTGVWFPSWFMWVVWAFVGYVAFIAVLTIIALILGLAIFLKIRDLG
nr:MAG TPA: zinc-ribbon containing domain protein [Caudoviricetes sp.]